MDLKSVLMGLSFAVIWASAFTATRVVVQEMPPLSALVVPQWLTPVAATMMSDTGSPASLRSRPAVRPPSLSVSAP